MALRVILPAIDVRKVGEPNEYVNKNGEAVYRTDVFVEDADHNPQVLTLNHSQVPLPNRGDLINVECDLSTYVPKGAWQADLRLNVVAWSLTETTPAA